MRQEHEAAPEAAPASAQPASTARPQPNGLAAMAGSAGNGAMVRLLGGPVSVQREPDSAAGPGGIKVITPPAPNGQLIRHTGTGVTFTDDPAYVKSQLESYVDKNGLDSLARFESGDELYTTAPASPLPGLQGDPPASSDPDYLRKVLKVVHEEIVTLRTHLSTFREDFQRRANDTLSLVLTDSERRINEQLEHYGVKIDKTTVLGVTVWTSFSGGSNDASKQLAKDAAALKAKLGPTVKAKEEHDTVVQTSGNWFYNPGAVDAANEKFAAVMKDYNTARQALETAHPMTQAYNLDPARPETAANLDKLSSDSADDRAKGIGEELNTRLGNIAKIRTKAAEDKEYVWKLEKIIGLTRELPDVKGHQFLTNPGLQASVVIEKAAAVKVTEELITIGAGIVLFGLGLIAAAPTGGMSLAGATAVAAAGTAESLLQVAMAYRAYQAYDLEKAAAGTDYERAKALSQDAPELFWLALDMVGAALGVVGGVKSASTLFRRVAALREEALTAKAMKLAAESKKIAVDAEQYNNAVSQLEATGNDAKAGAGPKLKAEVEQYNGGSRMRRSSAADLDGEGDGPPTVPRPDVGAANAGKGLSRAEAVGEYFTRIQANPDMEYGLIQHQVTREFRVVSGGVDKVTIPAEFGDGWAFVRHYHPNLETEAAAGKAVGGVVQDTKAGVFGARLPSVGTKDNPGDLIGSMVESMGRGKKPVSETLDWFEPATNRMRTTKFGYNPESTTPFWIEVPDQSGKILRGQFESAGKTKAWLMSLEMFKAPAPVP
jgi:hypothetical protein